MIFCSRRVFLNVLTQLLDIDTLLNANYFLCDQVKPTGYASISDEPKIGMNGEVTYGKSLAIPSLGYRLDKEGLVFGDKVKLIIIKED
jgi:hypothetical protein